MSGLAHHDAVVARIKARSAEFAARTFELGGIPDAAPSWYVVVASGPGSRVRSRYTGPSSELTTTHTVYSVGTNARQALWVAEGVEVQCLDHRFVVAGRNVRLPSDWVSRPVTVDSQGLFPHPFAVIQFDLTSEPS
jgi:hypothetical protein